MGEREWRIKLYLTLGATTLNLGCNPQKLDYSTLDFCLGPFSASCDVGSFPLCPWDTADIKKRAGQGNGGLNYI